MDFVELEIDGVRWIVASSYVAPVGIGEAAELARAHGFELPTSLEMVDAIWRAADLKVEPIPMSPNRGDDPAQFAAHAAKVQAQIDGRPYTLLAGTHKDVVSVGGKLGLYGWHHLDGRVIQGFFGGHALAWKDYSQGARFVRRATAGDRIAGTLAGAAIGGAAGGALFGVPGAIVGALAGAVGSRLV